MQKDFFIRLQETGNQERHSCSSTVKVEHMVDF